MKAGQTVDLDSRMNAGIEALRATIRRHYPEARFRVSQGEDDPTIVQLIATVDLEDMDPVLDIVIEQVLSLQAEGLPVFVVTERPPERTIAMFNAAHTLRRIAVPTAPC